MLLTKKPVYGFSNFFCDRRPLEAALLLPPIASILGPLRKVQPLRMCLNLPYQFSNGQNQF
jgi:hypothetical protein